MDWPTACFLHQIPLFLIGICVFITCISHTSNSSSVDFSEQKKNFYKEKVKQMFYHAYNGYLDNAYPLDELRPLTCTGMDTWGSFSLTLIDALDTLLIMGNLTEFQRAVDLVLENVKVDANVNVSVFETNIRVIGGLLSAHMLAGRANYTLPAGWPCSGPLLDLAERFAQRLLPAFNTATGMPYGTVNLRYGVNSYETPITCTAGVGTFILEFGTLSRLTGNPHYERVALKALKALWEARSAIGLVGNHINVQTGVWTATDAGIGAGVDSYFEYLAKGGLLFQRPLLMHQFYEYEKAINDHVRREDWFVWVSMTKAQVSLPIFQSLEAFWPGVLALVGKVEDASRILLTYTQILRQYGLPPEFYNLPNREATSQRTGYPLRPEVVESLLYVYQATEDPLYLHIAAGIIEVIEQVAKTSCGYATVKDVTDYSLEDRMESFFLSETTKYLYLLFDSNNFIHNDGTQATIIETTHGSCAIDVGGYIFNTEAHPLDPAIIYCCSAKRQNDTKKLRRFEDNIDFLALLDLNDHYYHTLEANLKELDLEQETMELNNLQAKHNIKSETDGDKQIEDGEEEIGSESGNIAHASTDQPYTSAAQRNIDLKPEGDPVQSTLAIINKENSEKEEKKLQAIAEIQTKKVQPNQKNALKQESTEEMSVLLSEIGAEFKDLIKSTDVLNKLSRSPSLQKALERVRRDKMAMQEPIVEAVCEDGCVPMDNTQDSIALRRMLNVIYGKHIYIKHEIHFSQGPICKPWENPLRRPKYFNTPPNMDSLEALEKQKPDINEYSFSSFTYSRLASERYNLLTAVTRPFSSLAMGLGQVVPAPHLQE